MFIKPHPTKNEYIRAGDVWVRNFTKPIVEALTLDSMVERSDFAIIQENQTKNDRYPRIAEEPIQFDKVVIISDGYGFDKKQEIIRKIRGRVAILAVNKALKKWKLVDESGKMRSINAYVVNNPYNDCLNFLPSVHSPYFPACVASVRTNRLFLERYQGTIYVYDPTPSRTFGASRSQKYYIDDYRNPICAAIGLAFRFGVRKLMLFCCDDSFDKQRESAVQLKNGLWTYPPHIKSHEIIDANLYWLTHQKDVEVSVADFSNGPEYTNAEYIKNAEDAIDFFKEDKQ